MAKVVILSEEEYDKLKDIQNKIWNKANLCLAFPKNNEMWINDIQKLSEEMLNYCNKHYAEISDIENEYENI